LSLSLEINATMRAMSTRTPSFAARLGALLAVLVAFAAVAAAVALSFEGGAATAPGAAPEAALPRARLGPTAPTERPTVYPAVRYRDSSALGLPHAGRLVRGTQLPERGPHFQTWDPIFKTMPNREWRRWGTAELVRMVMRVQRRYAATEPGERPMLVGDLSRTNGGDFGPAFGIIGHSTHQNGLDADVYYPRKDGRRGVPKVAGEVDRRLAQRLVDLFVEAGAETVLVGPNVALGGPPDVVKPYPNHDNHLHVRIPNPDS